MRFLLKYTRRIEILCAILVIRASGSAVAVVTETVRGIPVTTLGTTVAAAMETVGVFNAFVGIVAAISA